MRSPLFFFGYGYVAQYMAKLLPEFPHMGTTRQNFPDLTPEILDQFDHFLISIPPNEHGDVVLQTYKDYFKSRTKPIRWIGYLSTTGVYGDHSGGWINETTPATPLTNRSKCRLLAEQQWQGTGLPVKIYRLSGIYGPGRSTLDRIITSDIQIIEKPGHYFNRIHVDDICRILIASVDSHHNLFNLADNLPSELSDVYRYAYQLLNKTAPDSIPFDQAALSPMMREFYSENKRIDNRLIREILTQDLLYPTYKEGLQQCLNHQRKST
ncbi:MAG: SDR family oxidoreductase [Candidatus Paracaedibacteraceae bacterium]|nr:SDR family oxidoreductase [Candidatus Paracaedibacteraceae bacterium]